MLCHQVPVAVLVLLFAINKEPLVAANTTTTEVALLANQSESSYSGSLYAWSAWGPWGPCSRSCGGGVAVQERHCLPRSIGRQGRSRKRRKLHHPNSSNKSKRAIITAVPDCPGLGRRYHECNTMPCSGNARDARTEQCSMYDRRPFRGQYYNWEPFIDGNAPCVLNCRPIGQHFYASLALVADGTPCTHPGSRAICVQGTCKVVGRDGVLALSTSKELRCGNRLITGLFSRPRLPLGYTYVTTIPRGACQINISETEASDNYIALKVANSSIINGEFAISAPGMYAAAGSRLVYSRVGGLDTVRAEGPLQNPIEVLILYTRPKSNIKYEYMTDINGKSEDNEIPNTRTLLHPVNHQRHHHRHHSESHTKSIDNQTPRQEPDLSTTEIQSNIIGNRKFIWKILNFTPCSRTCGGGLQIGKYRCVEVGESAGYKEREVSPAHCTGSPPGTKRRRCAALPCPPRWRTTAWAPCPMCGPATRTRLVGCIQDHAKGITKISNQMCPLPMPLSSEPCNIPNCDGTLTNEITNVTRGDARRQVRIHEKIDAFQQGPVYQRNSSYYDITTTTSAPQQFNHKGANGWLYTEWSDCQNVCNGNNFQTRTIICSVPNGCPPDKAPPTIQNCDSVKNCEPQWFTSEWSVCSSKCEGQQVRGVVCLGNNGRRMKDSACRGKKPDLERQCGGPCKASWYLSDWSLCRGPCESALQTRTVWCARSGLDGYTGAAKDTECPGGRPLAKRFCVPERCSMRPPVRTAIRHPSSLPPSAAASRPYTEPATRPLLSASYDRPVRIGVTQGSKNLGSWKWYSSTSHPPMITTDNSTRQTRQQERTSPSIKTSPSTLPVDCADKLATCELAVQARLCHYPYYAINCCLSCHSDE